MKTLKTAVVVVLLLAVLYGLYTVLNKPEGSSSSDASWPQPGPLQIETGTPAAPGELGGSGLEFADQPGTAPPDMAAGPPNNLAGTFESDETEPQEMQGPPARKLTAPGKSAYGKGAADSEMAHGDSPGGVNSFVKPVNNVTPRAIGTRAFADAWRAANRQMQEGRHRQALASLSVYFDSPDLDPEEQRQLLDVLDPLAAKVIYSTEHLLENPYDVRRGEDLYQVAEQFKVPWLVLANINGIDKPDILLPGTRLKVLRGPFRADLKLQGVDQGELTLFLGDLYAGRFPVTIGNDRPVQPGQFEVSAKREWPAYYGPAGQSFPSRHPQNPYGRWWIELGSDLSIHSTATAPGGQAGLGCISLSPGDAADVYGILSEKSRIEIRR